MPNEASSWPFRVGNTLFCEEVRVEAYGKMTLIGAISGDVIVAQFPAQIKFSAYIEIWPTMLGTYTISVELKFRRALMGRGEVMIQADNVRNPAVIPLPAGIVNAERPGDLSIELVYEGLRRRVLKKSIQQGVIEGISPAPIASPPPHAQSRRAVRARVKKP
jgi:hypothetical protein